MKNSKQDLKLNLKGKISKAIRCLIAVLTLNPGFAMNPSLSWAGLPPSSNTKEEILWDKVSQAAAESVISKETGRLLEEFLKTYPDYSKAPNARYLLAERDFQSGAMQQAAVNFEKFMTEHPRHALADSASFRLAESYYNLKAYNSAFAAWEKMIRTYKKSMLAPNAMEYLTVLHMRNQDWGKADEQMKQIAKDFPYYYNLPQTRKKHGVVLYHMGDYSESAKLLEGLDGGQETFYRGLSLFSLKLFEDSVAALKNISYDKIDSYSESSAFLKAEGFFQKKNYTLAALEFQEFISKFPTSSMIPYAHARNAAAEFLVNEPIKAVQSADKALKGTPPAEVVGQATFVKASALADQKNFAVAADLFSKVINETGTSELAASALIRKAWCHKNLKQAAAQQKSLDMLAEKYPSSPQMALARFLEGAQHFENEKWEDAGAKFEQGLIRYPYSLISEMELALMSIAYTKAGRLDQLVTAGTSALKIFDDHYSSISPNWRGQSYYFIGKAYFDMERYSEAIPFFQKLATDYSQHALAPRAQLLWAWSLLETDQFDKAREKAVPLMNNPKIDKKITQSALFLNAVSHFNEKQYDRALVKLTDFIQKSPEDPMAPQARYLMGMSFQQKKVFGSAIDEWKKLIEHHPKDVLAEEAHLLIGTIYFKAGQFADAAKFFKQFRERWPNSKYSEIALWQEAQAYFNAKEDETLIKILPMYIEKYPASASAEEANKQLELVYYRRGANGDPAKLEEFLSLYPKSTFAPAARYKLGDMAMEQKKYQRAIIEMEQFVRDYPDDAQVITAYYSLGMAYEQLKDTDKAVQQYGHIMEHFASKPDSVDAAFRLGSLFFAADKFKEALEAFQFAVKKKVNDDVRANLYYNIAVCHENLSQTVEAARAYCDFAKFSKNPEQVRESLMTAGLLFKKSEKHPEAIEAFKALTRDAGSKETEIQSVNLVAECYQAMGKDAQAMESYEKLIGLEPVEHNVRLAGLAQLAFMYEQKKNMGQAIRVYEKIAVSKGNKEWVTAAEARIQEISKNINPIP